MRQANITMKTDFAFTHWACFECRKSFAKEPVGKEMSARKCPECAKPMIDMGAYFEPPRKLNKRRWSAMKIIADEGYKFRSEGMKIYIDANILVTKNPNPKNVKERIDLIKTERAKS